MAKEENKDEILVCNNKKAHFNYFLSEFTECGIELVGSEIKAIRFGHCSLEDSYVIFKNNECFILNMNIPLFQDNGIFSHEPTRTRKLLLHKKQIYYFQEQVNRDGYTLIPVKVYIKKGKCKVLIALGKGKKNYDKRETIKKRDDQRRIAKESKGKWVF